MKVAIAEEAIKFTCAHCGRTQYVDDTLADDTHDGDPVRSDVIDCETCGKENKVILPR